ncbi:hypothetical protein E4656_14990 [Natronospirillum operosum]|uniref:Uncharacterized protein n=1 Tax=Natronospirillum operosum TaxID=2759953 RepID=A0A4Z0W7V2_9GAMM|nr:hypothetical protein [Natronospirillum operosum]TGG91699.1 hypothetical protein E4656_14990 [Natronospirillum operosum]
MIRTVSRSIGAVVGGLLVTAIPATLIDILLESTGVFPPPDQGLHVTWMIVVALFYRTLFMVAGAYLTALIARQKPMLHCLILGTIGMLITLIGMSVMIDRAPLWFPVTLMLLIYPSVWLGGVLADRRRKANAWG